MTAPRLQLIAVPGIPLVRDGEPLAETLAQSIVIAGLRLEHGDVVVVAQKIVSKAEGRRVNLATVTPSARALELSRQVDKDPRVIELILRESVRVVRIAREALIVEHRLGFVLANAGIDQSNVADPTDGEFALLLPLDADASAARLREDLGRRAGVELAVIIADSFGRPWRLGTVGVAIGAAGLACVLDLRGAPDLFGRTLKTTLVGHADEIASAASLLMGQAAEALPCVIVRGVAPSHPTTSAQALLRPAREDLFR